MKSCRQQDAYLVRNAYPTTQTSRAHHQEGSLEAPKKSKKGDDNTPSEHH